MLRRPDEALNLALGRSVVLGADVLVGANVTIEDDSVVGDGCVIEHNAVIGKRPRLARSSTAPRDAPPPARLGARVTICTGAVVYAGACLGEEAIVGDGAQVRERSVVGAGTVVGRASSIDNDVLIGDRVKVQTGVYLTAQSVVEDDVFVGPGVTTTNDDTMFRHGPDHRLQGVALRRACRVGGGVVLVPGVEVGEEAFVAAGAVVTRDVAPRTLVAGVPARVLREVDDGELLERWR
jgi:acetyltransferase-like isoleucine patch superfamily enzyme